MATRTTCDKCGVEIATNNMPLVQLEIELTKNYDAVANALDAEFNLAFDLCVACATSYIRSLNKKIPQGPITR